MNCSISIKEMASLAGELVSSVDQAVNPPTNANVIKVQANAVFIEARRINSSQSRLLLHDPDPELVKLGMLDPNRVYIRDMTPEGIISCFAADFKAAAIQLIVSTKVTGQPLRTHPSTEEELCDCDNCVEERRKEYTSGAYSQKMQTAARVLEFTANHDRGLLTDEQYNALKRVSVMFVTQAEELKKVGL